MLDLESFQKEINEMDFVKHPYITFMDVLSQKYNDENLISNWLAFLFDSNINGLKRNKSIKQLLLAVGKNNIEIEKEDCISVKREASTSNQKRIDILIESSNTVIIIENKIDSSENGNQTEEYYRYAEKEFCSKKNRIYIYLKPNYNNSIPSETNFICITYEDLINKLREIDKTDYKDEEAYKYEYLLEFLRVGERYMKNEEFEISNEVEFYVKNLKYWNDISSAYQSNNSNLVKKIETDISNTFTKEKGYETYKSGHYIQIFKPKWINNEYSIHYEIWIREGNFYNLLGFEKVKIEVALHLEGNIPEAIRTKLKEDGIEKDAKKTTQDYNFKTDILNSIGTIIQLLKNMDEECCEKIDNAIGE